MAMDTVDSIPVLGEIINDSGGVKLATAIIAAVILSVFAQTVLRWLVVNKNVPLINRAGLLEPFTSKAKNNFIANSGELLKKGFAANKNHFRLTTDVDTMLILSPEFAEEIRADPRLSLVKFFAQEMHPHIHGFEPFQLYEGNLQRLVPDVVRVPLTQSLGEITELLPVEAADALKTQWTDTLEWHEIHLYTSIGHIVSQLSSRVFLGPELCRNLAWRQVTNAYMVSCFVAARKLRKWPSFLHRLVAEFIPDVRDSRLQVEEARRIMQPVVETRRQQMIRGKGTAAETANAVAWFDQMAKGLPYDPADAQLLLGMVGIDTSSDMVRQVLIDLCRHPELVEPLRQEIIDVVGNQGWKRATFSKLKLLDSVMKESQRLKPIGTVSMRRTALETVTLSDNTVIEKGSSVAVSEHLMHDPTIFSNPGEFDGYRFLKRADNPDTVKTSSLVAASLDHMGFGFGKGVCPGRFFVANEAKIVLASILLKYDFKLKEGTPWEPEVQGFVNQANPDTKLMIKRRKEEVQL